VDDDSEDYEGDRPRRRKRRKQTASSPLVLWLVLGGLGLLVLIGIGIALVWLIGGSTQSRLVGRWALDNPVAPGALVYEFRGDGTFTLSTTAFVNVQLSGTYSVSGNRLKLAPGNVNGAGLMRPGVLPPMGQMQLQIESVSATQLILSGGAAFGQQQRQVFKREQ
jgi:hypothetical protein